MIGLVALNGCGERSVEMGPVETVEAFYKAVSTGEWEKAEALCDTMTMSEYLEAHRQMWSRLHEEDDKATTIAQSMFAGISIATDNVNREDDKRIVRYIVSIEDLSKTKKATLRKVEGAWRVEKIQDAN